MTTQKTARKARIVTYHFPADGHGSVEYYSVRVRTEEVGRIEVVEGGFVAVWYGAGGHDERSQVQTSEAAALAIVVATLKD